MLNVQLMVAAVGVTVGVTLPQPLNDRAADVLTVRLTPVDAAAPVLGVAIKVPAYEPAAVPVVTVTVPQLAPPAHEPVGPMTVAPAIAEYPIVLTAACPVLLRLQLRVAAVGVVVDVELQPLKANAGGVLTVKLTAVEAAEPTFGVAVSVPL